MAIIKSKLVVKNSIFAFDELRSFYRTKKYPFMIKV